MLLRKINAGLSLLATILLLGHAILLAVCMWSHWSVSNPGIVGWILVWVMAAHAVLSIVLAVLGHKGAEKRKCNEYPKMNVPTMVQRIGGMLLIPFTALHVAGTTGAVVPPPFVHAVLPPLFFALALSHVAISFNKALITLGIGNAKTIKAAGVISKVICVATLIADVTGFWLYV